MRPAVPLCSPPEKYVVSTIDPDVLNLVYSVMCRPAATARIVFGTVRIHLVVVSGSVPENHRDDGQLRMAAHLAYRKGKISRKIPDFSRFCRGRQLVWQGFLKGM